MFGSSMMRDMSEDPFFSMHRQHMQQMNSMFQNPFGMMSHDPFMALTDGREQQRQQQQQLQRQRHARQPHGQDMMLHGGDMFGGMGMFGHMNSMMANMHNMMPLMGGMQRQIQAQNDPNSQFYSQSTVMSYSNTGDGQPRVYQATSSTRQAPGGVRETKKAVRDSETGVEKMSMGRHIGERGHVMERSRNTHTGDLDENQEFLNMDDTEKPTFDQEWRDKTRHYPSRGAGHHRHRAIGDPHTRYEERGHRGNKRRDGHAKRATIEHGHGLRD